VTAYAAAMPVPEIEEFAEALVRQVRDASVRSCDGLLQARADCPVAHRWRKLGAAASDLRIVVPDAIDETVFSLLQAIDQGTLRLKFVSGSGREIDLTAEGLGELSGWYMGSGGWRAMFSKERYVDDFADLNG
jgi:hypothetical protein